MERLSIELKVGLLILCGLLITTYASIAITGWRPGQADTYTLFVNFENASGLLPGSPVQVAGVRVGKVEDIALDGNEARIRLKLFSRYRAHSDAEVSVKSLGILGDKYVDLNLGSESATLLPPGGDIALVGPNAGLESLVDNMSQVLEDIGDVTGVLRHTLGGERGRDRLENIVENIVLTTEDISRISKVTNQQIDFILFNLREFTGSINRIATDNEDSIRRAVEGFADFGEQLASVADANRTEIDSIIRNVNVFSRALAQDGPSITRDLRLLLADNREKLGETVESLNDAFVRLDDTMIHVQSISAKLNEGDGTLAQLINEDTTATNLNSALSGASDFFGGASRLKLDVGGHVEYLAEAGDYKSFIDLRLRPLRDRFYTIQLVQDPRGNTEEKTIITRSASGISQTEEEITSDDLQLSFLIGQRYYDTVLQGGLMENEFGIGVEQKFGRQDQFGLGANIWDLDRDEGSHLKFYGLWRFFSNAFFIAGQDDAINDNQDQQSPFVGIGIHFNEDSLRPLIGTITGSAAP